MINEALPTYVEPMWNVTSNELKFREIVIQSCRVEVKVNLEKCSFSFTKTAKSWVHSTGMGSLRILKVDDRYVLYDYWEASSGNDIATVPFESLNPFDNRNYLGRPVLSCKKSGPRNSLSYMPLNYSMSQLVVDICMLFDLGTSTATI